MLEGFDFPDTKEAMKRLEKALSCPICGELPGKDPPELLGGSCCHWICRNCLENQEKIVGSIVSSCHVCGMPTTAKNRRPERTIQANVVSFHQLQHHLFGISLPSYLDEFNVKEEAVVKTSLTEEEKSSVVPPPPPSPVILTPKNVKRLKSKGGSSPGFINKKNKKGETQLHVACCKGDLERVKSLLEAGASANTQDNAGWTPLHEVAQRGYEEIVQVLLQTGAVDLSVPGGPDNQTPLHDAAAAGWSQLVKLLIRYGARKDARDAQGRTPRDVAHSDEIREVFDKTESDLASSSALNVSVQEEKSIVILCTTNDDKNKSVCSMVKDLEWKLEQKLTPEVTHLVITEVERNPAGQDCVPDDHPAYLEALVSGVTIVTLAWLENCKAKGGWVEESPFLLIGSVSYPWGAPEKSRLNTQRKLPKLFHGFRFYLQGPFNDAKRDLAKIIQAGSGVVLNREPDPESIPEGSRIPYHVDLSGSLSKCSYVILYQEGSKNEPALKYDMKHLKSLPLLWFFHCVHSFSIVEPFK